LFLGCFHLFANFIFFEMRRFPLVDIGDRMVDGGKRFFLPDRRYPFFNGRPVGALHPIEL
jgi:hypothetical protein